MIKEGIPVVLGLDGMARMKQKKEDQSSAYSQMGGKSNISRPPITIGHSTTPIIGCSNIAKKCPKFTGFLLTTKNLLSECSNRNRSWQGCNSQKLFWYSLAHSLSSVLTFSYRYMAMMAAEYSTGMYSSSIDFSSFEEMALRRSLLVFLELIMSTISVLIPQTRHFMPQLTKSSKVSKEGCSEGFKYCLARKMRLNLLMSWLAVDSDLD